MHRFLARVVARLTKGARRASASTRRRFRPLISWVRRAPLPPRFRRNVYRYLPWQPWTRTVPVDRLLLGGQNGLTATEVAHAAGDLLWPSTRVSDGPHARLLRDHAHDPHVSDEVLLASPYADLARTIIATTGNYFSARDDPGIAEVARDYLARHREPGTPFLPDSTGRSPIGSAVRVARIRHSDCFQVIDGHHRLASDIVRGARHVQVRAGWLSTSTPLQDTLAEMSWIGGQRELYQPLPAPELERAWVTVRRCDDRLKKMQAFLAGVEGLGFGSSYLDVASCYGWFVARMLEAGYDAHGVERDPLGPVVGQAAYSLDPARITVGDAETVLGALDRRYDVVSCLSLLHHFALGRGSVDAEGFLQLLDRVTGRVLVLDTGQSHEEWLSRRLPGWDTADVVRRLREGTTFDEVVDLGPDEDAVGSYAHNYGRHLFACVRRR